MTKISRAAAAALCAGGLIVAVPDTGAATPIATERPAHCLSGVRRVQGTFRHTPSHPLYTVQNMWITFPMSGSAPCLNSDFVPGRA